MFSLIYIEEDVLYHPQVKKLCRRFSKIPHVIIGRYTEVFNRKGQNFRLQKKVPALILAKKHQNLILKTPPEYVIGTQYNYYFSHLLNCPFDCRYCFLQGMYRSAHFVYFVNTEDFQREVKVLANEETTFFTGYDCDSLAFESITEFVKQWLPFIATLSAFFEFRTKSTSISPFLSQKAHPNCIIAFTLTPPEISRTYEHRAPCFEKRIEALVELQKRGWSIGLRFDPMIFLPHFQAVYENFFREVFHKLSIDMIHSVTLGGFRVPKEIYKNMITLYPKERLFANERDDNQELLSFCAKQVLKYTPQEKLFYYA